MDLHVVQLTDVHADDVKRLWRRADGARRATVDRPWRADDVWEQALAVHGAEY